MARTLQTRKRSRGVVLMRPAKRGRFVRRRRRFSGRSRLRGLTTRASGPSSIGRFRTRRTSRRAFRKFLWTSTLHKTHWRAVGTAVSASVGTGNDLTQASLTRVIPGNAFWTAAGGARPVDTGGVVPTFIGDIILRGGVSTLSVSNTPELLGPGADPVRVVIFTVWTNKDPAALVFPTVESITWDPSVLPDFSRFGRVLNRREAILKGDGEVVEVFFRHRVQKIDQNVYNNGGNRLNWFVLVGQTTNTEAVPVEETVRIQNSINYSFAADAQ